MDPDGVSATAAALNGPMGLCWDSVHGCLVVADTGNNRIVAFSPGGTLTTLAGDGVAGSPASDGLATQNSVLLSHPQGVAVAALAMGCVAGNPTAATLFVADTGNHAVRALTGFSPSDAAASVTLTTLTGGATYAPTFLSPTGLALAYDSADGQDDELTIADVGTNRVLALNVSACTWAAVAGTGNPGSGLGTATGNCLSSTALNGDGGLPQAALLDGPAGVTYDSANQRFLIADTGDGRIRAVTQWNPAASSLVRKR
jgi:hypothetical protein